MGTSASACSQTAVASFALNTGATILATRLARPFDPAARMQSRMRWTAHLCHTAPWNTSAIALFRPSWASETTSWMPMAPLCPDRLQEGLPGAIRPGIHGGYVQHMPPAAGIASYGRGGHMAFPAALHVGGAGPDAGHLRVPRGLPSSSSTSTSSDCAVALTWSLESLSTPSLSAIRCTFLVLVPMAYISSTAATSALSTRW